MTQTRLREVSTEEVHSSSPTQQDNNASIKLLMLALHTLGQRTIIALAALRGLVLAGSVFWLAMVVVANPTPEKLTGLGLYAAFVLIAELMVGRRK